MTPPSMKKMRLAWKRFSVIVTHGRVEPSMMHDVLLDIWTKIPTTTLFVTHDIDEALFLAERVVMMSARPGRVIEDIRVPFARPRRPELVTEIEFGRLKRHFLELLRIPGHAAPLPRLSPLGLWLPASGILLLMWRNHSTQIRSRSMPGKLFLKRLLQREKHSR
jgi:energy-coupling factor transporter ATP-binding protein EcfA2